MGARNTDSSAIDSQADELVRYWLVLGHRIMSRKLAPSLYPELANKLPRGQVHALVLLAEAGGLAERRRSTSDRRSISVVITKAGRKVVSCAREHQRALMVEVLAVLDPEERIEFIRLTAKAAEVMRLRAP
jgi:hypothetical protein